MTGTALVGGVLDADPTGVADSTAAFINAIGLGGRTVIVSPGNYKISGQIALPDNTALIASGFVTITTAAANFVTFAINGSNVTVDGFTIQNAAKTGGADFVINTPAGDIMQVRVRNVVSYYGFGFWTDSGASTHAYFLVWLTNCVAQSVRGFGFFFTRPTGYLYVENCTASFFGSANANFPGFMLDTTALVASGRGAIGGAFFRQCSVGGTSSGVGSDAMQVGYSFNNYNDVWMTDCTSDTCDSYGYIFSGVSNIHLKGCEAGLCNNSGFLLLNCSNGEFTGNFVWGRQSMPSVPGAHGILIMGGNSSLIFTGNQIEGATGDGYNISECAGAINIGGGIAAKCAGRGIYAIGDSPVLAHGVTLAGNAGGNYSMSGARHHLHSAQLDSGAVVTVGPGPITG